MKIVRYLSNWKNAHQREIIIFFIGIVLGVGLNLKQKLSKRQFRQYCAVVSVLYILVILYITVFSRTPGKVTDFNYEIFWSYKLALHNTGYLSQIILNIMMFMPLGIIWAGMVENYRCVFYLLIIFLGGALSCCAEYMQYYLQCGFSEIDDVISNVLGVILGILTWRFCTKRIGNGE